MLTKRKNFNSYWLLWAILFLGFVLRVHLLDQQSLWWDEAKTVSRTLLPIPDLLSDILSKRHHLPLFFLLVRPWFALVGSSEFGARFFSVICGVISLPITYKMARLIGGKMVGLVAAFLLAISPFHIWYSQEARMYTMVTLLILVSHYFVFRLLKNNSPKIGLPTSYLLCLLYTPIYLPC